MSLEDKTAADLKELARQAEVPGFSTMKKKELVVELRSRKIGEPESAAAPEAVAEPLGDPVADPAVEARLAAIEARLDVVEARVAGVDARTLPSSQLLRDTDTG